MCPCRAESHRARPRTSKAGGFTAAGGPFTWILGHMTNEPSCSVLRLFGPWRERRRRRKVPQDRPGTGVPGPHCDAVAVECGADVLRTAAVEHEGEDAGLLHRRADQAAARHAEQSIGRITVAELRGRVDDVRRRTSARHVTGARHAADAGCRQDLILERRCRHGPVDDAVMVRRPARSPEAAMSAVRCARTHARSGTTGACVWSGALPQRRDRRRVALRRASIRSPHRH